MYPYDRKTIASSGLHERVVLVNFKLTSKVPYGWLKMEICFFALALFTVIFGHFAELLHDVGDVIGIASGSHEPGDVIAAHTEGEKDWAESWCAVSSAWGWQGWASAPGLTLLQLWVILPKHHQVHTYPFQQLGCQTWETQREQERHTMQHFRFTLGKGNPKGESGDSKMKKKIFYQFSFGWTGEKVWVWEV